MINSESRTAKGFKNAIVALVFYIVGLLIQFISRRVFIQYLGNDILGLNSTATSLLQFLNMAEMGIGAAVAFTLYKPIAENDEQSICEIMAVQGWLYKRIAIVVLISALVLSCFFPLIFEKTNLPLWYAYATFGVLLFGAMMSYIFNYKQILLSAHQLEYKITIAYKLPKTIKDIAQILFIWLLPQVGYLIWVILEGLGAIVCTISLARCIKKNFPYIIRNRIDGGELRHKYSIIITKVKQLLFHKIGGFILFQTSPLIIYAYATLTLVAIYGNYMLVVTGMTMLLSTIFNGLTAGIGNAMQTNDNIKMLDIYRELYVMRFILVAVCCFGYAICVTPFTCLWVGSEYLLPTKSVSLIILIMFINMMRPPVEIFLQAKGMFQDIWAPIIEAVINLGLSLLLGYFFGLNGILVGVLISLIVIAFVWKPYFLLIKGLESGFNYQLKLVGRLIALTLIPVSLFGFIKYNFPLKMAYGTNLALSLILTIGFAVVLVGGLVVFEPSTSHLIARIKSIIKLK